ncbi:MAG: ATP-dependent Clp protease adapter ClpS [Zetaproteobacteria bacterium]|nr:MAG: ATP-dependent Clp protease adapter ClpS [Zetaproteobacteria bacterium]
MPTFETPDQEKIILELADKQAIKPPSMYEVLLLNDDFTPVDFVEEILMKYFFKNSGEAEIITMQVHKQGRGICGVFPKDIAESKALQVESFSRQHHHPLQCIAEKSE